MKKGGVVQPATDAAYFYYWWDGAVQSGETYTTDYGGSNPSPNGSGYHFDNRNQMSEADIHDGAPRTVAYTRDIDGAILARDTEGVTNAPHERYTIFGGLQLGDVSNDGTSDVDYATSINRNTAAPAGSGFFQNGATTATSYADYDAAYDPINGQDAPGNIGRYTVQNGESLQSIALAIWGDANLWYVLAQANGLSADSDLAPGSDLIVPANVYGSSNNASTFRVYDPNRALGNISPTHPPRPQHHNNCGVFGMILLAVIAVAVTVFTAGAAVAALAPAEAGITSVSAGIAAIASGTAGTFLSTGALIGIGAVAGAAGSIVSQGVGLALGIQKSFNWGAVGMAAIGGAVGMGMGPSGINAFGGVADPIVGAALNGAASNAITQGIGIATGLQKSFNFADVAAAGFSAGVMRWGGDILRQHFPDMSVGMFKFVDGMAGDVAYAATRSLLNGSDFGDNMLQGLPNVIGQTIGSAIGEAVADGIDAWNAAASRTAAVSDPFGAMLSGGACFVAGTLIHTRTGLETIERIRAGDWVASRPEGNGGGPLHWRKVLETYQHTDRKIVRVTVQYAAGEQEELHATTEHPFFVNGDWRKATELRSGDQLQLLEGGKALVLSVEPRPGLHTVYNFAVTDDHTYFVGRHGIWVHNSYEAVDGSTVDTAPFEADGKLHPIGSTIVPPDLLPVGSASNVVQLLEDAGGNLYYHLSVGDLVVPGGTNVGYYYTDGSGVETGMTTAPGGATDATAATVPVPPASTTNTGRAGGAPVSPQALGGGAVGFEIASYKGVNVRVRGEPYVYSFGPPRGAYVPRSGSTSIAFLSRQGDPDASLRLDYGWNKSTSSKNWHWNQEGTYSTFGVTNHSVKGAQIASLTVNSVKLVSRGLIVLGAAESVAQVYNSKHPVYEAGRQASGWAGAIVGGEMGAEWGAAGGAAIGAMFFGFGAVPGAVIGGFLGGVVGGAIGWQGGTSAYEYAVPAPG